MEGEVGHDLVAALDSLRRNQLWLGLLAENLSCASCEGFLQSSLLGALNAYSPGFVADRERRVGPNRVPFDLAVIRRADYPGWWSAVQSSDVETLAGLCRGIVELKLAWTRGNADGSATIRSKSRQIVSDGLRLREFSSRGGRCESFLCVVVTGFHDAGGTAAIEDAAGIIRADLRANDLVVEETAIMLLDGYQPPGWITLGRSKRLWSTLLLWQIQRAEQLPPV